MSIQSKLPGARCSECTLCECPLVPPHIPEETKLIVIGEAPGFVEVEKGEPFVGPSGILLDYALSKVGIPRENVHTTNIVMCRPPNNREPTQDEVNACRGRLDEELD